MNRIIKFRAWDKIKQQMVEPCCKDKSLNKEILQIQNDYILMQFTGLCDREGKEIYEGDIVTRPDIEKDLNIVLRNLVIFKNGYFTTTDVDDEHMYKPLEVPEGQVEDLVIGNIYETPELIKGFNIYK